jgi:short-subunit dehydrogenase
MRPYALITAAAGGIGKAFAAECAARGWNLFLVDLRAEALPPLATGLSRQFGVDVLCQPCDLSDPAGRAALWERIAGCGIELSFVINVAGMEVEGPFAGRSPEELRAILRLNVETTVEMTSRAVRFLNAAGSENPGAPPPRLHIINVASLAGFFPMPMKAVYAASKRFLIDFSVALRSELREQGISVTVLCPSGLPTNPLSTRRLEAQGFLGQLALMNVGDVAAGTIDAALAGRAVVIPGGFNRFLSALAPLVPPTAAAAFIWRRWSKLHRKDPEERK